MIDEYLRQMRVRAHDGHTEMSVERSLRRLNMDFVYSVFGQPWRRECDGK